jgi:hypothetical protein
MPIIDNNTTVKEGKMGDEEKVSTAQPLSGADFLTDKSKTEDESFDAKLSQLPEQYRAEILRQYEIPEEKVSLLAVLRFATLLEKLLMVIGLLMSIAAGTKHMLVLGQ